MLRFPAASAAVIACAASATSDNANRTISLDGRPHIANPSKQTRGTYEAGSILNRPK
jgi:hypothetical protein